MHTDALRDIVSELMDIKEVNRYFGRMLGGLATRYAFLYATPDAHPMTGRHCPDLKLITTDGGGAPLSRFTTNGPSMLLCTPDSPAIAAAAGWRDRLKVIEVTAIDHDHLSAALVRPDGVIAWACAPDQPADTALLRNALRTWLGDPS